MTAVFSRCLTYRYLLTRVLRDGPSTLLFIMCNPSTADGTTDDPTIRRCLGFARDLQFDRLHVVNLWAIRSTAPQAVRLPNAVGSHNDLIIRAQIKLAHTIVCAWSDWGATHGRDQQVRSIAQSCGRTLHCLGLTKSGNPRHPLYLRRTTALQVYLQVY